MNTKILSSNELKLLDIFISKLINANKYKKNNEEIEFETRLRTIESCTNRTKPGVNKKQFNKILKSNEIYLQKTIIQKRVILIPSTNTNIRVVYDANEIISADNKKIKPIKIITKDIITQKIINKLGIKFAISKETELNPTDFDKTTSPNKINGDTKYSLIRYYIRTTKVSKDNLWRIDASQVQQYNGININCADAIKWYNNVKNKPPQTYEIEIEYIGTPNAIGNNKTIVIKSLDNILSHVLDKKQLKKYEYMCNLSDVFSIIKPVLPPLRDYTELNIKASNILQRVQTLTREKYYDVVLNNIDDIRITEKADGERGMLFAHIQNGELKIKLIELSGSCKNIAIATLSDRQYTVYKRMCPVLIDGEIIREMRAGENLNKGASLKDVANDVNAVIQGTRNKFLINTVGATNVAKCNGKYKKVFMCFDMLIIEGKNITMNHFDSRYQMLQRVIFPLKNVIEDNIKGIDGKYNIVLKKYQTFNKDNIQNIYEKKRNYLTDGIIILLNSERYYTYNVFKWKPENLTTIDFLCRIVDDNISNKIITIYLYVGATRNVIDKFNLKPSDKYTELFGNRYENAGYLPIEFQPPDGNNNCERNHNRNCDCNDTYITKLEYVKRIVIDNKKIGGNKKIKYVLKIGNVEITDNIILEMIYGVNNNNGNRKDNNKHKGNDGELNKWIVLRTRLDKTEQYKRGELFGNNWYTALGNWKYITNPITIEQLMNPKRYYKQKYVDVDTNININVDSNRRRRRNKVSEKRRESNLLSGIKIYHGYIKQYLYEKYTKDARIIIELGSGRANDLNRWGIAHIKNIIMIDNDEDATNQGINKWEKSRWKNKLKLYPIISDLSKTSLIEALDTKFKKGGLYKMCKATVSNFSLHYFAKNVNILKGIFDDAHKLLISGGYFIITGIDGELLFNLFKKHGIKYGEMLIFTNIENRNNKEHDNDVDSNQPIKIKRLYRENKLLPSGQLISVYIESIGYFHDEYLLNFSAIKKITEKEYKVVEEASFMKMYNTFKDEERIKHRRIKLKKVEEQFSFINKYLILQKI